MREDISSRQDALYRRTDEILFYVWDPIGVSDGAWARDEYRAYLPRVFQLLTASNGTPEQVAAYLKDVVLDRMGLAPNEAHDLKVARLLFEIRAELEDRRGAS